MRDSRSILIGSRDGYIISQKLDATGNFDNVTDQVAKKLSKYYFHARLFELIPINEAFRSKLFLCFWTQKVSSLLLRMEACGSEKSQT